MVRVSAQCEGNLAYIRIHGEVLVLGKRKRSEGQRECEEESLREAFHGSSPE
jgi:hypothetical protein